MRPIRHNVHVNVYLRHFDLVINHFPEDPCETEARALVIMFGDMALTVQCTIEFINVRHMRTRDTVVCLLVCLSVTTLLPA